MMKSVAILGFIGAVGAGAALLAMRKTVINGKVMEADLLSHLGSRGFTGVSCDPDIPVSADGATFQCKLVAGDGTISTIGFTMDRGAQFTTTLIDEVRGPTRQTETPERVPSSGDPWNN